MGKVYHREAGHRSHRQSGQWRKEVAARFRPAALEHLWAPEGCSLCPEGSAALPPQRPQPLSVTVRCCPPQPRRTRSRCEPPQPGPAQSRSPPSPERPGRSHPGPPSPPQAGPQHGREREPSGSLRAPPRRSSPRYSAPGSESRSGLSILLPPLLPGFRPFPRRPTLPARLARWPRLGTRPSPPQFRAHSRRPGRGRERARGRDGAWGRRQRREQGLRGGLGGPCPGQLLRGRGTPQRGESE